MQISIRVQNEFDDDPESANEKNNRLLLDIHRDFPEAVWEKGQDGYVIFV